MLENRYEPPRTPPPEPLGARRSFAPCGAATEIS